MRIEESMDITMSTMAEKIHKDGDDSKKGREWMLLASINGKKKCQLLDSPKEPIVTDDDDDGVSLVDKVKEISNKTSHGYDDDHGDMCIEKVELIPTDLTKLDVGTCIVDDLDDIIFDAEVDDSDVVEPPKVDPVSDIGLAARMPLSDFIEKMKKIPLDCGSVYEDGVMSLCIGDSVYELSKDNVNFIEYTLGDLAIVIHVYYDEEINLWMVSPPEEEKLPITPKVNV